MQQQRGVLARCSARRCGISQDSRSAITRSVTWSCLNSVLMLVVLINEFYKLINLPVSCHARVVKLKNSKGSSINLSNLRRAKEIFQCLNRNSVGWCNFPNTDFLDFAKQVMGLWQSIQKPQNLAKLLGCLNLTSIHESSCLLNSIRLHLFSFWFDALRLMEYRP